jgi:hypothetical protein
MGGYEQASVPVRASRRARGHTRRLSKRMTTALTWDTFSGGTSAAEGKHGYRSRTSIGTYHVLPISSRNGRHSGYGLAFVPSADSLRPGDSLWNRVDKNGNLEPLNYWVPEFRSPQRAKAAARKQFDEATSGRRILEREA